MIYLAGALGFLVALLVSVMLHEAGHFWTARRYGMKATQFFVGFGPTLWSRRRGETEYGVKAVPAGGFVKIVGMTPLEDVEPGDEPPRVLQGAAAPEGRRAGGRLDDALRHRRRCSCSAATYAIGVQALAAPSRRRAAAVRARRRHRALRAVRRRSRRPLQAGLHAGDEVVAVDGVPVEGGRLEVVQRIRARAGVPAARSPSSAPGSAATCGSRRSRSPGRRCSSTA